MSSQYPEVFISDLEKSGAIVAIQDGNHGEKHPTAQDYVESGIPFIMANDITDGRLNLDTCHFITESQARQLRIGFSIEGDVLITHKGTIGNVAIVKKADPFIMLTPQVTYYRTSPDKLLNSFLAYAFRDPAFLARMHSVSAQGTRPYIGITAQRKLKVIYPKLKIQRKIATILSAYDDLIDNNLKRIALLEEAARQLYKEWFVYLRFPGHEHTRIMDGAPEGWEQVRVKDIGDVVTGKTPSTKEAENFGGDILFVKTPDMHGKIFVTEAETSLTERGANTQAKKFIPPGSIMVSCIGTIGVVSINPFRCHTNQQINSVIPQSTELRYFLYFAAQDLKPRMEALGGGATMNNINKEKFETLPVMRPDGKLLVAFNESVSPSFNQILNLQIQNQKLKQARDLLLPRLMSGEIPV